MTSQSSQYEVDGAVTLGRVELGVLDIRGNCSVMLQPSNSDQKRQKFVVGDRKGNVMCGLYGKDGDSEELWRSSAGSGAVVRFFQGGFKKTKDQIYALCDNALVAFKKTGTQFFRFPDPVPGIVSFFVHETQIVCITSNTVHVFEQTTKIDSFYCGEIQTSSIGPVVGAKATILVSTVSGSLLWLQSKVDKKIIELARIDLESPASSLQCEHDDQIVVGLKNGKVLQFAAESVTMTEKWAQYVSVSEKLGDSAPFVAREGSKQVIHSEITALSYGNMLKTVNGQPCLELQVGTYDGTVSMLLLNTDTLEVIDVAFENWTKEAVAYCKAGYVTSEKYMDLLVVYRSGRLSCFSAGNSGDVHSLLSTEDKGIRARLQNIGGPGRSLTQAELDRVATHSVEQMQSKVDEMRNKVAQQKDKQRKQGVKPTKPAELVLDVLPRALSNQFRVVLSSELPLEVVSLKTSKPVRLELVDSQLAVLSDQSSDSVVMKHGIDDSFSIHADDGGSLLNFRCADAVYRLEFTATQYEGDACSLQAYCILRGANMRFQLASNILKPLCLHKPLPTVEANAMQGLNSYARINITGDGITVPVVYHWLDRMFYGVVSLSKGNDEAHELAFQNRVDGTVVLISFATGKLSVHTANITTAKTLRSMLTAWMNEARLKIGLNISLKEDAVLATLAQLRPLFHIGFEIPQQALLRDALSEVSSHEPNMRDFFDPALQAILDSSSIPAADTEVDVPLLCENALALFDSIFELKGKLINLKLKDKLKKILSVQEYSYTVLEAVYKEALASWR